MVIGECIGWAGRAGAHHCPYSKTLFSLQISILIICEHPSSRPAFSSPMANPLSPMLLQRRHLLHSRPDDQPARTQVQPNFLEDIPLCLHHLRHFVHHHPSYRWWYGFGSRRKRPAREHQARHPYHDGWYHHSAHLDVCLRSALARLPLARTRCALFNDTGLGNDLLRGVHHHP